MNLHIAFPVALEFHPNKYEHTGAILEKFSGEGQRIKINDIMKAIVDEDYETARSRLILDALDVCKTICRSNCDKIKPSDFTLVYSLNTVDKDGRVWGGGCTVSYYDMKDIQKDNIR